jgi:hypothetical protein
LPGLRLGFSIVARTPEFKKQKDIDSFGSVNGAYAFWSKNSNPKKRQIADFTVDFSALMSFFLRFQMEEILDP